jgi:hypothetical protein
VLIIDLSHAKRSSKLITCINFTGNTLDYPMKKALITRGLFSVENVAAVRRSLFPFSAPGYVLQGSADCPLHHDPEGIAKRRSAPRVIHR